MTVEAGEPRPDETVASKTDGSVNGPTPQVLAKLADLVATGAVGVPVAATYPQDRVTDALVGLERRHAWGKIALIP